MRILGNTFLAVMVIIGLFGCDSGGSSGANNSPLPVSGEMGGDLDGEGGASGGESNGEVQGGSGGTAQGGGSSDPGDMPNGMIDGVSCDRSGFTASEQIAAATEYGIAYQALTLRQPVAMISC